LFQIHQAEYKGDSRSYIEANFSFESSTAQAPAEFFIYTSNPNDPKINSVELTSPNGVKYTTQLSDLHDINVIKIDAVINEVCHFICLHKTWDSSSLYNVIFTICETFWISSYNFPKLLSSLYLYYEVQERLLFENTLT